MLAIRLMRLGAKKKPFYRIVVVDSRKPRETKTKDVIGHYDPLKEPPDIKIDMEKVNYWVERGAQTSETVKSLLNKVIKTENISN